ncbi:MAG: hypothetical protein JEZ14_11320 [Marinilabiliaceae bacterium]|nr:hypothetical protein [Marinilabiliaceae bacterium]
MEEINNDKMEKLMELEYVFYSDKCEMHYKAVENAIKIYFILIGIILSAFAAVYKDEKNIIEIFQCNYPLIVTEAVLSFLGCITFFRVVEHRLLILSYVRSLNGIRKWYCDTSSMNVNPYFIYKPNPKLPTYFSNNGHFFWELLGLAFLNSCWLALVIYGLFCHKITFLITIFLAFTTLQMLLYRHIALNKEKKHSINS